MPGPYSGFIECKLFTTLGLFLTFPAIDDDFCLVVVGNHPYFNAQPVSAVAIEIIACFLFETLLGALLFTEFK